GVGRRGAALNPPAGRPEPRRAAPGHRARGVDQRDEAAGGPEPTPVCLEPLGRLAVGRNGRILLAAVGVPVLDVKRLGAAARPLANLHAPPPFGRGSPWGSYHAP